jgi:hypothetical protein
MVRRKESDIEIGSFSCILPFDPKEPIRSLPKSFFFFGLLAALVASDASITPFV